jgi:uncharacterized protein YndB with AHSA1/START domain
MLASRAAANSSSFKVTTPSDTDIHLSRLFDAPRHLVFEAMTKPEHVKQWWGNLGEGYSVPVCEIDLRVGGTWRLVNKHPKGEAAFHGEYLEIVPPSRLAFTEIFEAFPDSVSTVYTDLIDEGGKTRMSVNVRYESKAVRDMVMSTGMDKGAAISYDRLEDLVISLSSSSR